MASFAMMEMAALAGAVLLAAIGGEAFLKGESWCSAPSAGAETPRCDDAGRLKLLWPSGVAPCFKAHHA